ncbi:transporter major facilitator family protein [Dorea sp. CAG:317]|mgnify:CR=1 FL=1|nr:transporter major facilitator family protein [Dorea sp. CAG:317]
MDKKKSIMVLLLSFGIVGIYGFPYMKGTFYNVIKAALCLSDIELSRIWGVFGTVGMLSYVVGGYFTDRFSPRKILTLALVISSFLHLYVSFVPSYPILLIISGLMGLAAVFAFFPASSKVLSYLGSNHNAGKVFGVYYALEGLGGMIVNSIGSRMYMATGNELETFVLIVRLFAVLNLVSAIGVYYWFSEIETKSIQGNQITFSQMKHVFGRKEVWLIAVITMCNFLLYCSMTYITPYLTDIYGVSEGRALIFGIVRVNILTVFAGIIFGRMADWKQSALKVIEWTMPIQCVILCLLIGNQMTIKMEMATIILTMVYAFAATGVKTICLVLITESEFPMLIVGTVIGVVSFIGYSPDAFLYPVAGKLLDMYGKQGYSYLFCICLAVAVLAIICCRKLQKVRREECEKRSNRISDFA